MVKKNRFWLSFIAAIIIVIDGVTKYLVDTRMAVHETITLPVNFVQLTYVRNFGAAFGVLQHQSLFFICIAVLTIGLIFYYFEEIKNSGNLTFAVAALMLGGAIGNLIDRVRFGYVIDFIDLKVWPVFNVADIALTTGMILIFIQIFFLKSADSEEKQEEQG